MPKHNLPQRNTKYVKFIIPAKCKVISLFIKMPRHQQGFAQSAPSSCFFDNYSHVRSLSGQQRMPFLNLMYREFTQVAADAILHADARVLRDSHQTLLSARFRNSMKFAPGTTFRALNTAALKHRHLTPRTALIPKACDRTSRTSAYRNKHQAHLPTHDRNASPTSGYRYPHSAAANKPS